MRITTSSFEEDVKNYQREAMKRSLKEGFEQAARDADMLELVEWGMEDYKLLSYSRE